MKKTHYIRADSTLEEIYILYCTLVYDYGCTDPAVSVPTIILIPGLSVSADIQYQSDTIVELINYTLVKDSEDIRFD